MRKISEQTLDDIMSCLTPALRKKLEMARKEKAVKGCQKLANESKASGYNCFLKEVKGRWKKNLLIKDDFKTPEDFLNDMVSGGKSVKKIIQWMEAHDICSGGDAACQRAVEVAWLLGAWDVSWSVCSSQEAENQDLSDLVRKTAKIVAEHYC